MSEWINEAVDRICPPQAEADNLTFCGESIMLLDAPALRRCLAFSEKRRKEEVEQHIRDFKFMVELRRAR